MGGARPCGQTHLDDSQVARRVEVVEKFEGRLVSVERQRQGTLVYKSGEELQRLRSDVMGFAVKEQTVTAHKTTADCCELEASVSMQAPRER